MKHILPSFTTILLLFSLYSNGQIPIVNYTPIATVTGLSNPLDVVSANDGTNRIFIVQRGGVVRVYISSYTLLNSNFLTLSGNFTTGGERGLLSLAFHPDYENNRYFFVYYTNAAGGVNIDRFQTLSANPNQADVSTRTNIISVSKPVVYSNHNGGKLNFGPDGNLYAGFGDSGSSGDPGNLAQNGNSLWGKMIRINVDNFSTSPFYTNPLDNPFVSNPAILDEIFSLGLRNPWRWSFDRLNGNVWIADVGQDAKEEVNALTLAQASAANYGWRCYEGFNAYNTAGCLPQASYTSPIFDYPHNIATGGFSITGGYVYRGTNFPALYGYYVCTDYVSGNIWVINAATLASTLQTGGVGSISGYGELENGELLAVSLGGTLYTVGTSTVLPLKIINWIGQAQKEYNQLTWQTTDENNVTQFEITYSQDGISFENAGMILAKNESLAAYSFKHPTQNEKVFYRLKIIHKNGSIEYSNIIQIKKGPSKQIQVINFYNGNSRLVWLNIPANEQASFQLFNLNGQNLLTINNYLNNKIIDLQKIPTGIYIGKIIRRNETVSEKILLR